MKPLANWQLLLQDQLTRGVFFMHPQMILGMFKQMGELSLSENIIEEFVRADFTINAISSHGDSYNMYDEAPEGSTAIFPIHGSMLKYGTWYSYGMLEIAAMIREAGMHKNVSSVVLDFDTGGGSVSAVSPLSQAINEVKRMQKPVVAAVDLCCSAGIWVAADCDLIIAKNNLSAEVGSIGVKAEFMDIIPYYEKLGLKHHSINSTHSPDKNKAFELAMEGKYELIRTETLDPLAISFQNHIKSRRSGKLDESAPGVLTGATFFAEEAKAIGLIDEIGNQTTAIERAQQLAESRKFLSQS